MRLVTCDLALACCINFGHFTRLARRVLPIFALSSPKGVAGLYAAPDGPIRPPVTRGNLGNDAGELERIHEVVWVRRGRPNASEHSRLLGRVLGYRTKCWFELLHVTFVDAL